MQLKMPTYEGRGAPHPDPVIEAEQASSACSAPKLPTHTIGQGYSQRLGAWQSIDERPKQDGYPSNSKELVANNPEM